MFRSIGSRLAANRRVSSHESRRLAFCHIGQVNRCLAVSITRTSVNDEIGLTFKTPESLCIGTVARVGSLQVLADLVEQPNTLMFVASINGAIAFSRRQMDEAASQLPSFGVVLVQRKYVPVVAAGDATIMHPERTLEQTIASRFESFLPREVSADSGTPSVSFLAQIQAFARSKELVLRFPSTLTPRDRFEVHEAARSLGLKSISSGVGPQRCITVQR